MSLVFIVLALVIVLAVLAVVGPWVVQWWYYSKHPGDLWIKHDYTIQDGKVFRDFFDVLWHRRILGMKIVTNLHYRLAEQANNEAVESTELSIPGQLPIFVRRAESTAKMEQQCTREEWWTNRRAVDIMNAGYLPVTGMPRISGLLWAGVPVYMSVTGAVKFAVPTDIDPKTGMPQYPQHTPALLENMIRSQATRNFLSKFRKGQGPAMDTQAIIMLIVLVVGAIIGMKWMGIF